MNRLLLQMLLSLTVSVSALSVEVCNQTGEPIRFAVGWDTVTVTEFSGTQNNYPHSLGWYHVAVGQCFNQGPGGGHIYVEGLDTGRYWGGEKKYCIANDQFRFDDLHEAICGQRGGRAVGFWSVGEKTTVGGGNVSQLVLENNSGKELYASYAHWKQNMWVSNGWLRIAPGQKAVRSIGAVDKVYFMAFAADNSRRYSGQHFFCVKAGPEHQFADNGETCRRLPGGAEMIGMMERTVSPGAGGVAKVVLTP